VSSLASSGSDRHFQRFADGFGRLSVALSVLGLVIAVALTVPSSWLAFGGGDDAAGPTYTDMTPADPVRLAVGGASGVQLVAPLVKTSVEPRQALLNPPDDAPLVSWWDGSAQAGAAQGQTVLLAHAGPSGGALTQLAELTEGDAVELLTTEGTMRYEVRSVRSFHPRVMQRASISLFKQDGGTGRLVLLSAEAWDGAAYGRTVVVTATPLGHPAD